MKSVLKTAFILTMSLASLQVQAVTIRGAPSCGKWIEVRKTQSMSVEHVWLNGYLSGLSSGLGVDALNGVDNDSVALWMDNYCKANPLSTVSQGGNDLLMELIKRNNLRIPK